MSYSRPIVISIAGFDPSGGAGVLCDVKTFEQHFCLGMAVLSAQTIQTENECLAVKWLRPKQIIASLKPLLEQYPVRWIKIGLIQDISTLLQLCRWIKAMDKGINIVSDTVLKASTGCTFIRSWDPQELRELYGYLYLVTPNIEEVKILTGNHQENSAAKDIAEYCSVLLKGGHSEQHKGEDWLFWENKKRVIKSGVAFYWDKHGTGCILSAAITANLALGLSLPEACTRAKKYVEKVANSNPKRLAYHYGVQ